ncbi:ABC transporter ATP-binding protein [Leifsonia sp. 1010]|uniref:ABC transporter ATP-binding protein n=1 Tax=Leifsonia sp. 1010 TaxID=2817769 RepID=UPI002858571F|nr:ABC transporter ATP-binding protein [Leifsonia sp. 1010]MDR6612104.1 putative ABC transport system ATP-binding protein [Leifsonia sp. 1010]
MTIAETRPGRPDSEQDVPLLVADGVTRTFETAAGTVTALAEASLTVRPGELVVVKGPSGSGKTTLLNVLSGLDRASSGRVVLDGVDLSTASEAQLVELRRRSTGFVFQSFGLVPVLSAAENVELPLRLLGIAPAERDARVEALLDSVGLGGHARQRPTELSGGQQQRVGIARALAGEPRILFADEPTGQLDSVTGRAIMDLLVDLVHGEGIAAVVTTHDPLLMARADRVLELHDGRLGAGTSRPRGRHAAPLVGGEVADDGGGRGHHRGESER